MTTGGLPVLDPSRGSPPVFDAGAGVTVASHDLSGAVTARLVGDDPGFQGLPPATAVFELSVDGVLDGVAEVRLPLSVPLAEDEVVITTDSFSWFAGVRARTGDVIDTARCEVIDPWTADVFVGAEHPECRDEHRAREDGYEVFSDDEPTVYWCFGRAGDSRVPAVQPPADASALALELKDRRRCCRRTGVAWSGRLDGLAAGYYCYSPPPSDDDGDWVMDDHFVLGGDGQPWIDRRHRVWTVRMGGLSDAEPLPPPDLVGVPRSGTPTGHDAVTGGHVPPCPSPTAWPHPTR